MQSFSDGLNGKEIQKNGDMCMYMFSWFTLMCSETDTILYRKYTPKLFFSIMAENFSNRAYDLAINQKQLHIKTAQWIPNGMEPKNLMSRYIIISTCCVVQSFSCFWLFATPRIVASQASLSFINPQEFAQSHVHSVDHAMQPSHPLMSLLLPLNFSNIMV